MSYDIYSGLLKAFAMSTATKTNTNFSYDNNNPHFNQLKSNYPIETVAGNGDDFSKAVNLMNWVSEHIFYKGDYEGTLGNSLDLLNYAYNKGESGGINCVALATILSDCMLAVGLKARRAFLMPCSPYDGDFHAVTHVYIREMNKWVMLDPTFNLYFSNEQGEYLSLLELRDYLANQNPVIKNNNAKSINIEYFAKNLFYFQMFENSTFGEGNAIGEGQVSKNRIVILSPPGYDAKKTRLDNIEYRMKIYNSHDNPVMQKWVERLKQEEYFYCSVIDFE